MIDFSKITKDSIQKQRELSTLRDENSKRSCMIIGHKPEEMHNFYSSKATNRIITSMREAIIRRMGVYDVSRFMFDGELGIAEIGFSLIEYIEDTGKRTLEKIIVRPGKSVADTITTKQKQQFARADRVIYINEPREDQLYGEGTVGSFLAINCNYMICVKNDMMPKHFKRYYESFLEMHDGTGCTWINAVTGEVEYETTGGI